MRDLYLTRRFFLLFGYVAVFFVTSYVLGFLFPVALSIFVLAVAVVFTDFLLLFNRQIRVEASRRLPALLSLGDANKVFLHIKNDSPRALQVAVIDELPVQFQKRDFRIELEMPAREEQTISYELTPVQRGEYEFGVVNLFARTNLGFVKRRFRSAAPAEAPVYPSVIQMKHYEQLAFQRSWTQQGLRKIRRIGHSYEFEQIKNYVPGDDYRSLNWKATSRSQTIMVNQYEDERSQQIYCILDKSRVMKMPFHQLSLLDYAINTSLAILNIALKKYDKAGLITFSDKIGTTLKADRKGNQLNKILSALYNEAERPAEANYELLFHISRTLISGRSLLLLYTNFESMGALDRVLPILRKINPRHLLVVIFFENTEIQEFVKQEVDTIEAIYTQTIAHKFLAEKSAMAQKLQQYGIQTILTKPAELSLNTVNKYLELKSRGLI